MKITRITKAFIDRMKGSLKENEHIAGRVLAIKNWGREDCEVIEGLNIITDDGDDYYAQKACGQTPTYDFAAASVAGLLLGTGATTPGKANTSVTTPISGSGQVKTTGYPKTADGDGRNTGAGTDIVTWLYSYAAGVVVNASVTEGAIVNSTASPTHCLTHFLFASPFAMTAPDTLAVFINHEFLGV